MFRKLILRNNFGSILKKFNYTKSVTNDSETRGSPLVFSKQEFDDIVLDTLDNDENAEYEQMSHIQGTSNAIFMSNCLRSNSSTDFLERHSVFRKELMSRKFRRELWYNKESVNHFCFTLLFGLYRFHKYGDVEQMWQSLKKYMDENGVIPHVSNYHVLLMASLASHNWTRFDRNLENFLSTGMEMPVGILNLCLRKAFMSSDIQKIEEILGLSTQRNMKTFLILLGGYRRLKMSPEFLKHYEDYFSMDLKGFVHQQLKILSVAAVFAFEWKDYRMINRVFQSFRTIEHNDDVPFLVFFTGFNNIRNQELFYETFHLYFKMNIPVTTKIVGALILGFFTFEDFDNIMKIREIIKKIHLPHTERTMQTLMHGYWRSQKFDMMVDVYEEMTWSKMRNEWFTVGRLFQSMCNRGKSSKALVERMMKLMIEDHTFMTNSTSAVIKFYLSRGDKEGAWIAIDNLKQHGIHLTIVNYHSLITHLFQLKDVDEVKNLLAKMKSEGIETTEWTENLLIDGYGALGMDTELFEVLNDRNKK